MNKWLIILLILVAVALIAAGGTANVPDQTPAQQIAALKQKVRAKNLVIADLHDQIDAQDALIADQIDTITRLRTRLANQPAPLDAVLAGSPDDLWAAMTAIWRTLPTRDPGTLCGYARDYTPGDGSGITLTSYTFYKWAGC